jgi:hypothetical protein
MIQTRTHPLSLYKIKAHAIIEGNKKTNKLTKAGNDMPPRPPLDDYEHAHFTPYYLYKDWWHSMDHTPYKGLIRHLQKYITKNDRKYNLEILANSSSNIQKWTTDTNIDNKTLNGFWTHPFITDF